MVTRRHKDALAIVDPGAINISGIAHAIVGACAEIRGEPSYTGNAMLNADPAIRLMVNQLSFLVGNGEMDGAGYNMCVELCKRARDAAEAAKE